MEWSSFGSGRHRLHCQVGCGSDAEGYAGETMSSCKDSTDSMRKSKIRGEAGPNWPLAADQSQAANNIPHSYHWSFSQSVRSVAWLPTHTPSPGQSPLLNQHRVRRASLGGPGHPKLVYARRGARHPFLRTSQKGSRSERPRVFRVRPRVVFNVS